MTAGWGTRTLRAAMFAAVCVLLAALGHALMSERQVPAAALAAALAVTAAVGWALAARERGPVLVVAVVVAAQTALHTAFSYAQSATGGGTPAPAPDTAGTALNPLRAMSVPSLPDAASEPMPMPMPMGHMGHMSHLGGADGGPGSSFGMLAAHLLAALLCGLWLAYGEQATFRILRAVAARLAAPLRLLLALPVPPDRPRVRARRHRSDRAPRLLLVHAITSRGPPHGTAAA
ncbi:MULTISPECIES: hypothetical protein [unclassified Streptomyces]|uniref:hypothetical protein n=1 Tax=unclassified Streptomyces TaxID=2593676 RepID=UPI003802CC1B